MVEETVRVAVVQQPPVVLDRAATVANAVGHLRSATAGGARLVAFPEASLPGDPDWAWRLRPEGPDRRIADELRRRLLDEAGRTPCPRRGSRCTPRASGRPDVVRLEVDRSPRRPASFGG